MEIPQGRRDYAEVLGVFDSLKEMDIIPTIEMFDGAVQQCERSGNAKVTYFSSLMRVHLSGRRSSDEEVRYGVHQPSIPSRSSCQFLQHYRSS